MSLLLSLLLLFYCLFSCFTASRYSGHNVHTYTHSHIQLHIATHTYVVVVVVAAAATAAVVVVVLDSRHYRGASNWRCSMRVFVCKHAVGQTQLPLCLVLALCRGPVAGGGRCGLLERRDAQPRGGLRGALFERACGFLV